MFIEHFGIETILRVHRIWEILECFLFYCSQNVMEAFRLNDPITLCVEKVRRER